MSTYERVTFRTESGKSRTIYLHRPTETTSPVMGKLLSGVEVNREGDEVSGKGFDVRRHVISADAITKRTPMHMNNIYGILEVDDAEG